MNMNFLKCLVLISVFLQVKTIFSNSTSLSLEHFCSVSWLHFTSKENCVQIVGNSMPNCVYQSLFEANIRIRTYRNYKHASPLNTANKSDCETFLQTNNQLRELKLIFRRKAKLFYTFTKVFIINFLKEGNESEISFDENEKQYIYKNALNVYIINARYNSVGYSQTVIKFEKCRNVLTGKELNLNRADNKELASFYENELEHPLLDVKNPKNNFSVSFFNCSPFVIYVEDEIDNENFVRR